MSEWMGMRLEEDGIERLKSLDWGLLYFALPWPDCGVGYRCAVLKYPGYPIEYFTSQITLEMDYPNLQRRTKDYQFLQKSIGKCRGV